MKTKTSPSPKFRHFWLPPSQVKRFSAILFISICQTKRVSPQQLQPKIIPQMLLDGFRRKKTWIEVKINSGRIDLEYKEQFLYLFRLLSAFLKKKTRFCSKLKSQVSRAYFPFCYYDNDFLPQSLSPFRTHTFMP